MTAFSSMASVDSDTVSVALKDGEILVDMIDYPSGGVRINVIITGHLCAERDGQPRRLWISVRNLSWTLWQMPHGVFAKSLTHRRQVICSGMFWLRHRQGGLFILQNLA